MLQRLNYRKLNTVRQMCFVCPADLVSASLAATNAYLRYKLLEQFDAKHTCKASNAKHQLVPPYMYTLYAKLGDYGAYTHITSSCVLACVHVFE